VGGQIYGWGNNSSGQLGLPDRSVLPVPTVVPLPYEVKCLETGAQSTMLIDKQDGRAHFLGVYRAIAPNATGEAGEEGQQSSAAMGALLNPESWTDELSGVKVVAVGDCHGLFSDGTVIKGYGYNSSMQATGATTKDLYVEDRLPVKLDDDGPPCDIKELHAKAAQSFALMTPKPGSTVQAVRGQ